jgi:transcriptional regulator with XRE-family HTH domain
MSQIELGAAAGYDRNFVGQIEKAQKSPSFRTLWDLCIALRLRPSVLMQQVEDATFQDWAN